MSDPKIIYLGPACQEEGDGREWCEDDVWTLCECGCSSVRYVLENAAQSELAALREEFTAQLQDLKRERQKAWDARDAAEQRNAELVLMLTKVRDGEVHEGRLLFDSITKLITKPTESGASE